MSLLGLFYRSPKRINITGISLVQHRLHVISFPKFCFYFLLLLLIIFFYASTLMFFPRFLMAWLLLCTTISCLWMGLEVLNSLKWDIFVLWRRVSQSTYKLIKPSTSQDRMVRITEWDAASSQFWHDNHLLYKLDSAGLYLAEKKIVLRASNFYRWMILVMIS